MSAVEAQPVDTSPSPERAAPSFEMPRDEWLVLFARLAAGKSVAYEELWALAARRLYGLALWRTSSPEDAAEVVQEVFVRVAEQRHRLVKIREPRAWLLTVTRRLAIDHVRRSRRRATEPLDARYLEPVSEPPHERAIDAARASASLATLPPAQRDVIYLHHYADCTFATIGTIMGTSTFTAASRYRLGITKLRRLMEGHHEPRE